MSTFDYSRLQATALRLIERFGRSMTLRRLTQSTSDTSEGATAPSQSDETVQGVDVTQTYGAIPGRLVANATGIYLLAASGMSAKPAIEDLLIVGTEQFVVRKSDPVQPGETALVYEVQVGV